jgi:hypothetical protein
MDSVPFRVVSLPELVLASGADVMGALCVSCGQPLELHQPDAARPDRLLGACPACGQWHVVQTRASSRAATPPRRRAVTQGV